MSNQLPCGHSRDNLTEIEGQPTCYVCWAIDSGNYTFDLRTGPELAHAEVTHLAEKVRQLTVTVAEHGRILHQLLNQEGAA